MLQLALDKKPIKGYNPEMIDCVPVAKNRIAEILRVQNITAYALAKKIGRRPHVITRLILGQRNASDKLKVEISQGLGLSVSEVFYFDA